MFPIGKCFPVGKCFPIRKRFQVGKHFLFIMCFPFEKCLPVGKLSCWSSFPQIRDLTRRWQNGETLPRTIKTRKLFQKAIFGYSVKYSPLPSSWTGAGYLTCPMRPQKYMHLVLDLDGTGSVEKTRLCSLA
jgi:hypothetical protein